MMMLLRSPWYEAALLLLVWLVCLVCGDPDPANVYGRF